MAIGIVKTINGVKQLVPLTTDSGQGLPLGAWTSFEDDQPRNGYLKAGTTFNQSDYPALYTMLGTNVVPDKGYGLDWDNAEAITLSTTDYVIQKNGWLVGYYRYQNELDCHLTVNGVVISTGAGASTWYSAGNIQVEVKKGDIVKFNTSPITAQEFHYVPYLHPMFIKAVIGPIEDSAADQVVQNINNSRSYSLEEVNTGKKWIDGKPIYRKVINTTAPTVVDSWYHLTAVSDIPNVAHYTDISGIVESLNGVKSKCNGGYYYAENAYFHLKMGYTSQGGTAYLILEYTKTTD